MPVQTSISEDATTLSIKVEGRFDFSSHQEFRDAYESAGDSIEHFVVDMEQATYLDSSALGMLLLLRDHAGGDEARIAIQNCNSDVKKILTISNFEQLFDIS